MSRTPCCGKVGLRQGSWTPEEDKKLVTYVTQHGHGNWRSLPARAGLERCGKSCRLRWINYLKPDIKRGNFSLKEKSIIIQLHALLGNKWSIIAANLPNRTDNEIKNFWNTNIKKSLIKKGIDPITHKPKPQSTIELGDSVINHMAQWESVRLEAEARSSMFQQNTSNPPTRPARLIISNIPITQPNLHSSSESSSSSLILSTIHNYNMSAIMLATDGDLRSPVSTLSFPASTPNIVAETSKSLINGGEDSNIVSTVDNNSIGYCMQDDDIMIVVEAFRASRRRGGGDA